MSRASSDDRPPARQLAVFNSRYPALSHTFIQREVEALRALGVDVVPFSSRRPTLEELGEGADATEIARTVYLLSSLWRAGLTLVPSLLGAPVRAIRVIAASQRLSPGGVRARLRHLAHALEAILLTRELRRRRLDTVHVHMANKGAMVALLGTVFDPGVTYSLTIHGSAEFFDMDRLRVRQKAEGATFVRFVSDTGRAQVMAFTDPSSWNRFHLVHCGVDPTRFTPRRAPVKGTLQVLAIGRLARIKGFQILLGAMRRLAGRGVPWELRVVGDGPERGSLEAMAERFGIRDRVRFLGPLAPSRVQAELETAAVLVVSSFMEGIPVVLMEAMAAGVPVVATNVGGVHELVEHGVTGRLVRPGSEEGLAAALEDVCSDPESTTRLAVAARARVEAEFDVRVSAKSLLALFDGPTRASADGE
jgi:glycosyltransferase involved in cell wall biosynthesis